VRASRQSEVSLSPAAFRDTDVQGWAGSREPRRRGEGKAGVGTGVAMAMAAGLAALAALAALADRAALAETRTREYQATAPPATRKRIVGIRERGRRAPEKTVTSLGRKGVLDLAEVNARPG
jgi:hypothetical protein